MGKVHEGVGLEKARILIVDDHPLVRAGLAGLIRAESDLDICGEAGSIKETLGSIQDLDPDLIIVDLSLEDGNGLELIKRLTARNSDQRILVCSMHDEAMFAERALKAGAKGYINKQEVTKHVVEAIRKVLSGKFYLSEQVNDRMLKNLVSGGTKPSVSMLEILTDRELEVFEQIGRGKGPSQIAEQLNLSVKTIESHREKIKKKLNLASGSDLTRRAMCWVLDGA